jgi:hypothetical protein
MSHATNLVYAISHVCRIQKLGYILDSRRQARHMPRTWFLRYHKCAGSSLCTRTRVYQWIRKVTCRDLCSCDTPPVRDPQCSHEPGYINDNRRLSHVIGCWPSDDRHVPCHHLGSCNITPVPDPPCLHDRGCINGYPSKGTSHTTTWGMVICVLEPVGVWHLGRRLPDVHKPERHMPRPLFMRYTTGAGSSSSTKTWAYPG